MAGGFPNLSITKNQYQLINKAMRTPNPTMRKNMLRTVKR